MTLAYNGATAGTTLSNPPVLMAAAMGGHVQYATTGSTAGISNIPVGASGAKIWFYASSNSAAELASLNSIGDGVALGMTIGDIMIGVTTTAASTAPIAFMGVLVTSAGATGFGLSSNVLVSTGQ